MISADVLGERARLTPDSPALVVAAGEGEPLRLTYRELDRRASAAALALRALGVRPGDRVALLAHNRVEFLDLFFAAGKGACVLVPLGTRLTAHEIAPILADAGATLLVYDGDFAAIVSTLAAMPEASGVWRWIALDSPVAAEHEVYERLVSAVTLRGFAPVRRRPEDLYCLLYTSGTTGRPKGVMIPHRQVAWNGYNTVACWQLTSSDVSPIFTPLYHAGGLFAFLVPIFTIGGTIVLHRAFDPAEIWRTVERERCSVILGVPTIWQRLLEAPEFTTIDLSSIRALMSGGAPLPLWIAEAYQARGLVFKQGFGMTEVGVNCFAMTIEESVAKRGSIGKPMMHTEVRLAGADGEEVAVGEIGELWFRGPHVSLGYWNRPEANAEAFVADPRTRGDEPSGNWFRSGDLARRDADGFFYIAGRAKEMFISGGVNVYPAEIEAAILQHPGVRDAAVVGVDDPAWGEVGVAFVVEIEPGSADEAGILAFLGERLARYKLPKAVIPLADLPRTAYGKVVKGDLRDQWRARRGGTA
jgi:fatty-acyl-CoA synthase